MRIAMGAAAEVLRAGAAQLDRGAAAVQRGTSSAVPAAPAPSTTALTTPSPATPVPAAPSPPAAPPGGTGPAAEDLLAGMTQLVLARTTVGAGVATARAADDAYRAVLDLGRR